MLNVEGERSRWSREFSRPRFKRVSNDPPEARRLVKGWGGRQETLGQSSGNRLAILPAFVGKERVTKFWEARVTSTCPQFVSRAKREREIFYVFCSGKSVRGERVGSLGPTTGTGNEKRMTSRKFKGYWEVLFTATTIEDDGDSDDMLA